MIVLLCLCNSFSTITCFVVQLNKRKNAFFSDYKNVFFCQAVNILQEFDDMSLKISEFVFFCCILHNKGDYSLNELSEKYSMKTFFLRHAIIQLEQGYEPALSIKIHYS